MSKTSLELTSQTAAAKFHLAFGCQPGFIAVSPGRVNLIGEHIDYNDGIVLPFAIDRYLAVAGKGNGTKRIRLKSHLFPDVVEIDLSSELKPQTGCWTNYAAGVVKGFQDKGVSVEGFDGAIFSDIPMGAGLSSSAALEVAVATLIESLLDINLEKREKAKLCQNAEWAFAGVPCGIMDQFACVYGENGKLIRIDCDSEEVELVPWDGAEGLVFVITDTKAKHSLADGEYSKRKSESSSALQKTGKSSFREVTVVDMQLGSLNEIENKRGLHVISEIDRTKKTVAAIKNGDWNQVGELMFESHYSLRDHYEVSCDELDQLIEIAAKHRDEVGVIGSRMTGGGFGGSTISLVGMDHLTDFIELTNREYLKATGKQPTIFPTLPSKGAHIV